MTVRSIAPRNPEPAPLRWEDAAEVVTVTGWSCNKCHRWYGEGEFGERAARYCCGHQDRPCEAEGCQGRAQAPYITCHPCMEKHAAERWAALPRVEWDGTSPICEWSGDQYIFSLDDLDGYLADNEAYCSGDPSAFDDLRFVLCEPDNGREFSMSEFLEDSLPDEDYGQDLQDEEINDAVNAWIKENAPFSWHPGKKAISVESIRRVMAGYGVLSQKELPHEA